MYGGNYETWVWGDGNWKQKFPSSSPGLTVEVMAYDKLRREVVALEQSNNVYNTPKTWVWDGENWVEKFPVTSPPVYLDAELMVYDIARREMVLQGSYGGNCFFCQTTAQTWVWDGDNWTQRFPLINPWRTGFGAMAYDASTHKTVLFGATEYPGDSGSDTAEWDGNNWEWKNVLPHPVSSELIGPAPATYDASRHEVVLFGGKTWVWKGSKWKQEFPRVRPTPLFNVPFQSAYDAATHTTVLFLSSAYNFPFSQTWVWNGDNWKQKFPATQPSTQLTSYVMSSNVVPKACPGGRD